MIHVLEMNNISVDHIEVSADSGADIWACIREAVLMCLKEDREVHLTHNDRVYLVNPKSIIALVLTTQEKKNDTSS